MRIKSLLIAALISLFVAAPSFAWVIVQDIGANNELIDNNTDDMIDFAGRGGADNTDIRFDLDGTGPVISSPTDSTVEIAGTAILNTVTIATALTLNEELVIALNAADEEIAINQTATAGTADVGLIKINDDRTGATADVIGEATLWIDAEGVYAIGVIDGAIGVEGGVFPSASGGTDLGSTTLEWNDLFLNDAGKIQLGDDQDVTITHVADAGILIELDDYISFGDAAVYIESNDDGYLDLVADTGTRLSGEFIPTTDDGGALGAAGNNWSDIFLADAAVINLGDDQDVTITHVADTGIAITLTTTFGTAANPDASDGAALGTTSAEWSDLFLADSSVINLGADQDVTITHVPDVGITVNLGVSARKIITTATSSRAITTAEAGGGIVLVTAAGVEVSLPDLCDSATGAYVTIVQRDASEVIQIGVTDTADDMYLDGVALGANQEIDSAGAAQTDDYITLVCTATNEWHQIGKVGTWVDGGAAD